VNRMGFSQRLELRQSQALVMTPQLQQAIKMLQLSNLELNNFVDAEIQQNPLLERREWTGDQAPPAGDAANGVEQPATAALPEGLVNDLTPDATEHWHAASGVEGDGSFDLAEEPQAWRSRNGALGSNDRPGLEHTAARPRTLREHVLEQIGTDLSDQGDQLIALHLLDLLDENGYLGGAVAASAIRPGRRLRPRLARMPCASAARRPRCATRCFRSVRMDADQPREWPALHIRRFAGTGSGITQHTD